MLTQDKLSDAEKKPYVVLCYDAREGDAWCDVKPGDRCGGFCIEDYGG